MPLKVGNIFTGARALLNDQENQIYTNTVLMEYFQIAYEKLRQECEDNNLPITNKTSEPITINLNVFDIGGPTGPALPNDLIEPITLWEIPAETNCDYMKMRQMRFLPKTSTLTAYLEVWSWADEYAHFLGANGVIQVKIDYVASTLGVVTDENSLIRLKNSVNYLKCSVASMAAMFMGENESRAAVLAGMATDALDQLTNIKVKMQQAINTRRRPFMASYKQRGTMYGR